MPEQIENRTPAMALTKSRRDMIEATGRFFQMLGLPRSTGQIYGLLYMSPRPLALDDLVEMLSMSKGSASMGTRQLAGWGAIRQVWVPGERRDYYEAVADLKAILKGSYSEYIKPRLNSSERRLSSIQADLERDEKEGVITRDEYEFCQERLKALSRLQKKVKTFAPLAEKFFS
jgi:HTH-type transcriptional regulator, glycine betaine synthesis regulator